MSPTQDTTATGGVPVLSPAECWRRLTVPASPPPATRSVASAAVVAARYAMAMRRGRAAVVAVLTRDARAAAR